MLFAATANLISFAEARKPASYRYGEMVDFESGMRSSLAQSNPNVWVIVPKGSKHYVAVPASYRYGKVAKKKPSAPSKPNFRTKIPRGQEASLSKKYGYALRQHKQLRMNKEKMLRLNGKPASYRYGERAVKKQGSRKSYKPFTGNQAISSYRYGQEWTKKQAMKKNKVTMPPSMADVLAFRDMPIGKSSFGTKAKSELDMIIKPFKETPKVKRNNKVTVELIEDADGKIRQVENEVEVIEVNYGSGLKQKIVNVKSFDGKDSYVEGEFVVFSADPKPDGVERLGRVQAASLPKDIKDRIGEVKDKIDWNSSWVRGGFAFAIGLVLTVFILFIGKVLANLWIKMDRRREEDENKVLLKGELDTIHPISIVYKN